MKAENLQHHKRRRRIGRKARVRKRIRGTAERPRMTVQRSNRFMYVQLIDDRAGKTLAAASTRTKDVAKGASNKSTEAAEDLGKRIAEAAQEAGIKEVIFDKGWYRYHGRIKAMADAARDAGLQF